MPLPTRPKSRPNDPVSQALAIARRGDQRAALKALEPAIRKRRDDPKVLELAATLNVQLGNLDVAAKLYKKLAQVRPSSTGALHNLASIYTILGRIDDAVRILKSARERFPDETRIAASLAEGLMRRLEYDEAESVLAPHMAADPPDPYVVVAHARLCMRTGRLEDGERAVSSTLVREIPRDAEVHLRYRHGDILDKLQRYDEAFDAYRQASDLNQATHPWDPSDCTAVVNQVIRAWSPEGVAGLHRASSDSDMPVFIVGMPRSGTTLVEQILDRHPDFTGLGEIASFQFVTRELRESEGGVPLIADISPLTHTVVERAGADILRRWKKLGARTRRASDKTPHNFANLGMMQTLLPGSRVIHCIRDPRDTCLSCYFQQLAAGNNWSYDLDHLVAYYKDYSRLMDHWRKVLDIPILDVHYEDIVSDIETQTRRMLEFVGLEYNADCVEFHESERRTHTASLDQVRQPLYASSVGRWKHYEKHLGPLAALEP
jgi:Flp pilus assembly protein TadD